MLKLGTQGISSLYLGEQGIKKAYLGDAVVFDASGSPGPAPSRLPEGYTEVEYISLPEGGSIAINVVPSFSVGRYVFDAEFEEYSGTSAQAIIYSPQTTSTGGSLIKYFNLFIIGKTRFQMQYLYSGSATGGTYTVATTSGRILIDWDFPNKRLLFGEKSVSLTPASETMPKTVSYYIPTYGGKIYSGQAYFSGVLKCDLVPCINPSGVVGCYDVVQAKFRTPSKTATAGPAV